ncbi:hypothetical protein [Paenibacillus sp. ISL-20]|uniref:hypothetical protein n=1 Tax=Paenibacillus sp. ISL-20 TaxID=2819163 RepID=UPI001BE79C83|nr:hypothetical protein [Paenibacillus sp. ISL-20]MBT2759920.1 hypothetical protein [Paenibacillus sp. ISL-20]
MSETVHYRGILKMIERYNNETLEDQCKRLLDDKELPSYCDSYEEFFLDENFDKAVIIDGMIYLAEKEAVDSDSDIFKVKKINDNEIEFEVRYYNGGCSFNEAIDEAFNNMK